jgi:hypothetical protein
MDRQFFETGLTPEEFIARMGANRPKFEQLLAECTLDDAQQRALAASPPWHVLVIAEEWSGDVVYNLPVLICAARAAGWRVRIFYRDQHPDLILPYRKDGLYHSIPVFVFFDDDFNEVANWIERPAVATRTIDEESLALRRRLREEHKAAWRQAALDEFVQLAQGPSQGLTQSPEA